MTPKVIAALEVASPDFQLSYGADLRPTQTLSVVVGPRGERHFENMRWGLIPYHAKLDARGKLPGWLQALINLQGEKLACETPYTDEEGNEIKPSPFRNTFRDWRHHCIVPADGFYEWTGAKGSKRRWMFRRRGDEPLFMAGLWDRWNSPAGEQRSFTIITRKPNPLVQDYHNRMPVLMTAEEADAWLQPTEGADMASLLSQMPAELLRVSEVHEQEGQLVVAD